MNVSRGRSATSLLIAFLLLTAATALGQERAPQPTTDTSGANSSRWEIHASLRLRPEWRDNADFQPANDSDAFWGQQLRISVGVRLHSWLSGFFQVQDVHLWGAERDAVTYQFNVNLRQFYLDWTPRERLKLRTGRQELLYGNQRLVGPFGWDTVGRTFDGARMTVDWSNRWATDLFAARLVEVRRGTPHRVGNQDLYGMYTRFAPQRTERVEFYALYLHDGLRSRGELPTGAFRLTGIYTFGGRVSRPAAKGFRYDIEHAWQFGERGDDRHRAAALAAQAGYTFDRKFSPLVSFEYDFATGDRNPADGRSGEFHNLFPTNHYFYGHADLVGWRNMHDLRATLAAQLRPKVRVQVDYHRFLLASRRGQWSSAGGQTLGFDPTGGSGRDLGQEVDLMVRIPLSSHLQFETGYSLFVPGAFARATRGPELHHFAYLQTWFGF